MTHILLLAAVLGSTSPTPVPNQHKVNILVTPAGPASDDKTVKELAEAFCIALKKESANSFGHYVEAPICSFTCTIDWVTRVNSRGVPERRLAYVAKLAGGPKFSWDDWITGQFTVPPEEAARRAVVNLKYALLGGPRVIQGKD